MELHTKLEEMLQKEDWEEETPFDYNEVHILYSAVHMYLIELKFAHKQDLIAPCIKLCQQFSLIVEHADKEVYAKTRFDEDFPQ